MFRAEKRLKVICLHARLSVFTILSVVATETFATPGPGTGRGVISQMNWCRYC